MSVLKKTSLFPSKIIQYPNRVKVFKKATASTIGKIHLTCLTKNLKRFFQTDIKLMKQLNTITSLNKTSS